MVDLEWSRGEEGGLHENKNKMVGRKVLGEGRGRALPPQGISWMF